MLNDSMYSANCFALPVITLGVPGAGIEFVYTSAEFSRQLITSLSFRLVTAIGGAPRLVRVLIGWAPNSNMMITAPDVQLANSTIDYHFSLGIAHKEWAATAGIMFGSISKYFMLDLLNSLASETVNRQAGDQFSAIYLSTQAYHDVRV